MCKTKVANTHPDGGSDHMCCQLPTHFHFKHIGENKFTDFLQGTLKTVAKTQLSYFQNYVNKKKPASMDMQT